LNFLAHFHLAKNTDASRVGALLGDFVRGTPESLRTQFPDKVIDGIIIDIFYPQVMEFAKIRHS